MRFVIAGVSSDQNSLRSAAGLSRR